MSADTNADANTGMNIAPLEYVVIGLPTRERFTTDILPELKSLQQTGTIQVVDLVFATKDADGALTTVEVTDLPDDLRAAYNDLLPDLAGLLTPEDLATLTTSLPPNASAVILLLEHRWTLALQRAVQQAGGTLHAGGLVTPDVLQQLADELAASDQAGISALDGEATQSPTA